MGPSAAKPANKNAPGREVQGAALQDGFILAACSERVNRNQPLPDRNRRNAGAAEAEIVLQAVGCHGGAGGDAFLADMPLDQPLLLGLAERRRRSHALGMRVCPLRFRPPFLGVGMVGRYQDRNEPARRPDGQAQKRLVEGSGRAVGASG